MFVCFVTVDILPPIVFFGHISAKGICLFSFWAVLTDLYSWVPTLPRIKILGKSPQWIWNRNRKQILFLQITKTKLKDFQLGIFSKELPVFKFFWGVMLRIDAKGRHLDELAKNIWGKHGMQEQIGLVPWILLRNLEAINRKCYGSSEDLVTMWSNRNSVKIPRKNRS